jgi:hypothetical protein
MPEQQASEYPDECIRGISDRACLADDGTLGSGLFQFSHPTDRTDGWLEESINWKDDEAAIQFTMDQTKEDGTIQFKVGIAIIPRAEIDRLNKLPSVNGVLSYERQASDSNRYHGNILLRANVPKLTQKRMCGSLASLVSFKIIREGVT